MRAWSAAQDSCLRCPAYPEHPIQNGVPPSSDSGTRSFAPESWPSATLPASRSPEPTPHRSELWVPNVYVVATPATKRNSYPLAGYCGNRVVGVFPTGGSIPVAIIGLIGLVVRLSRSDRLLFLCSAPAMRESLPAAAVPGKAPNATASDPEAMLRLGRAAPVRREGCRSLDLRGGGQGGFRKLRHYANPPPVNRHSHRSEHRWTRQ